MGRLRCRRRAYRPVFALRIAIPHQAGKLARQEVSVLGFELEAECHLGVIRQHAPARLHERPGTSSAARRRGYSA